MTVTATAKRRRRQCKQDPRYRVRSAASSKARNDRLQDRFEALNKRKGKRR